MTVQISIPAIRAWFLIQQDFLKAKLGEAHAQIQLHDVLQEVTQGNDVRARLVPLGVQVFQHMVHSRGNRQPAGVSNVTPRIVVCHCTETFQRNSHSKSKLESRVGLP